MTRASELGLAPIENPDDWERYYAQVRDPLAMPWTCPLGLDPDVARALASRGLGSGRALDVGTGSGNQALELARRGFDVTGSDLAPSAVREARKRAADAGLTVRFVVDDALATRLEPGFDLVLDRACFQVLAPDLRARYARTVAELLAPGGLFLLKAFSDAEPRSEGGPYRFGALELVRTFGAHLALEELIATRHHGTLAERPAAWLGAWRKPAPGQSPA